MLRTYRLLPCLETSKSFDSSCNKEHELTSLVSIFRGSGEVEVTYTVH